MRWIKLSHFQMRKLNFREIMCFPNIMLQWTMVSRSHFLTLRLKVWLAPEVSPPHPPVHAHPYTYKIVWPRFFFPLPNVHVSYLSFTVLCFLFCFGCEACGILVPQPGIEPMPPCSGSTGLNHWTAREVPNLHFFYNCSCVLILLIVLTTIKIINVLIVNHEGLSANMWVVLILCCLTMRKLYMPSLVVYYTFWKQYISF